MVTYEVLVGVASCVSRAPQELTEPAWDVLLRILRVIVRQDSESLCFVYIRSFLK